MCIRDRPETEQVVEVALAELDALAAATPLVFDLGTGSGAIALSVAVERPAARVWAGDAPADALAGARANPCRLYTSPSPRDRNRTSMPSSA